MSIFGWQGLGAAALGVLGYILAQFVGKPIQAYWDLKREIARCLVLYANADSPLRGDDPVIREARQKFRELASSLVGLVNSIPLYGVWARLGAVPSLKDLEDAKANLIGLSNAVGEPDRQLDNGRRYRNIQEALRLMASN